MIYNPLGGIFQKMKKYAFYFNDDKIIFGLVYDFKSSSDCEITVYNDKYPSGREVTEKEHATCIKYIMDNDLNFEFVDESKFFDKFKR